jgi:hypothetical protein
MNATIRPLALLNRQAAEILIREMGVVDAHRFLSQFQPGTGDYTKERGQWLNGLSLHDIFRDIKARKKKSRRGNK